MRPATTTVAASGQATGVSVFAGPHARHGPAVPRRRLRSQSWTRRPRRLRALLLVGAAVLIWAAPAYAIWSNTAASNAAFSSATLEPPTNLSLTFVCVGRNRARATLSWTPTTSSFAEGYVITAYRSSDPSNSVTFTVTPASESSVSTIIDSRPPNTEYTAEMYSFGAQWTSVVVSTTGSTPSPPGCR